MSTKLKLKSLDSTMETQIAESNISMKFLLTMKLEFQANITFLKSLKIGSVSWCLKPFYQSVKVMKIN